MPPQELIGFPIGFPQGIQQEGEILQHEIGSSLTVVKSQRCHRVGVLGHPRGDEHLELGWQIAHRFAESHANNNPYIPHASIETIFSTSYHRGGGGLEMANLYLQIAESVCRMQICKQLGGHVDFNSLASLMSINRARTRSGTWHELANP